MAEVNAPSLRIPDSFMKDVALRGWNKELNSFLYLLWNRSGGGDDEFDNVQDEIDAINAAILVLQTEMDQAELDIDALQAAVAALQIAVTALEAAVGVLNGEVATLNTDVSQLQTEMLDRTRWLNLWVAGTYERSDQVRDGPWTMIANIQTSERAGPQPIGPELTFYEGTIGTGSVLAKVVTFGNRYAIQENGYINSFRIYTVSGIFYEVFTVTDPLGDGILQRRANFQAVATGWTEFSVESTIVLAGSFFDLSVLANEPDDTPTPTTVSYDYVIPQNVTVPTSGQISHSRGQPDSMQISYTDQVAGDRTTLITGLTVGDTIEGAGFIWTVLANLDVTTYANVSVSPNAVGAPAGVQDFLFNTTSPTQITYALDTDYWLTSPHSVQGLLIEDGLYDNIIPDNTAYGTDITYQRAEVSPDWDLVAHSSGSAGRGGTDQNPDIVDVILDQTTMAAGGIVSDSDIDGTPSVQASFAANPGGGSCLSTISRSSGKWAFEARLLYDPGAVASFAVAGISLASQPSDQIPGGGAGGEPGYGIVGDVQIATSTYWHDGVSKVMPTDLNWEVQNERVMILIDLDNNTLSCRSQGQPGFPDGQIIVVDSNLAPGPWFASIGESGPGGQGDIEVFFGERPFSNTLPPGYKSFNGMISG